MEKSNCTLTDLSEEEPDVKKIKIATGASSSPRDPNPKESEATNNFSGPSRNGNSFLMPSSSSAFTLYRAPVANNPNVEYSRKGEKSGGKRKRDSKCREYDSDSSDEEIVLPEVTKMPTTIANDRKYDDESEDEFGAAADVEIGDLTTNMAYKMLLYDEMSPRSQLRSQSNSAFAKKGMTKPNEPIRPSLGKRWGNDDESQNGNVQTGSRDWKIVKPIPRVPGKS